MIHKLGDEAKQEVTLQDGHQYIGKEQAMYTMQDDIFDFDAFYAGLSHHLVPRRAITAKVKDAIKKLAFLYGISA